MRVCCEVADPDGSVVFETSIPAEDTPVHSVAMAGHVIRLFRAGDVNPEVGQRLTVWVERGRR